jgi:hypothetical protein
MSNDVAESVAHNSVTGSGTVATTPFDWNAAKIGDPLPSYEYELTQEMIDKYRAAVQDSQARFPTIAVKEDTVSFYKRYHDVGSVNARCTFYCYGPPTPGTRISVKAWIADKYYRRDKPYLVTESVSVDQHGRLIDRVITHELKRPLEVGAKWKS